MSRIGRGHRIEASTVATVLRFSKLQRQNTFNEFKNPTSLAAELLVR